MGCLGRLASSVIAPDQTPTADVNSKKPRSVFSRSRPGKKRQWIGRLVRLETALAAPWKTPTAAAILPTGRATRSVGKEQQQSR
jgi:hypothetical protein